MARPMRLGSRCVAIACGFAALTGCSSSTNAASPPTSTTPRSTTTAAAGRSRRGTYVQPAVTISDLETLPGGKKASFRADSGTVWHGDLEGRTEFVMHGVVDPATFASTGTNDEVFTGTVAGLGSGKLHFAERFTNAADGTVSIDARIVGAEGALEGLRGTMHFSGRGNPQTGAGTGTYTAQFSR